MLNYLNVFWIQVFGLKVILGNFQDDFQGKTVQLKLPVNFYNLKCMGAQLSVNASRKNLNSR